MDKNEIYEKRKYFQVKKRTASIISCKGSKACIIPGAFFSEKKSLDASSNASCHNSCHKIATRISSRLTIIAFRRPLILDYYGRLWNTYLRNDQRAMFLHSFHDRTCCVPTRGTGRFRSHRQRVYQGLRVVLANIRQQVVNISPDICMRRLNTGNDLIKNNYFVITLGRIEIYLWNDL